MLPMQQKSRLCVLLLDHKTHRFLSKIPVYAEMSVSTALPPYVITEPVEFTEPETPLKEWLSAHASVLTSINEVIVANLSEEDFRSLTDKHSLYVGILQVIKDRVPDTASESERREGIRKHVLRALSKLELDLKPQKSRKVTHSYPLGTLASDHAGYVSFDLRRANAALSTLAPGAAWSSDTNFFLYPFGRDELRVDVTQQDRWTPQVVFGKVPLELPFDFDGARALGLPSMQGPGLEDWYLSPGSFALNPEFFIGADNCENLYPANFATQEFRFFQIVRGKTQLTLVEPMVVSEVRAGWSLEYLVSWQPLGHTLGEIVYSLPLAPGETIKIAVIDWARKSIDSRTEDLAVAEQLAHNTHRDRGISETVDAAMHEWQRGGSFMGGVAGSYGGAGYGISGALGGGYSTSSGDREVHASTVQQISDAFAQASSSVRELRSTVVVQSDQREGAKAETRVVANHNHSHALTMLYYEVLRHYKVTTRFMRLRPSLLVQYSELKLDDIETIAKHRQILESALLDARLAGSFDAVQKLICFTREFARKKAQAALLPDLNDFNELGELKLVIKTRKATPRYPYVFVLTKSGERIGCLVVEPLWAGWTGGGHSKFSLPSAVDDGTANLVSNNYRNDGMENVFTVTPFRKVLWNDIAQVIVRVNADDLGTTSGPTDPWEIDSVLIRTAQGALTWIMVNKPASLSIAVGHDERFPVDAYKEVPKDPEDLLSEEERCAVARLKSHLTGHAFHYRKAIWLTEDPNERASRFRSVRTTGNESLLDLIDNRPLDVYGDYVVFPARRAHETSRELESLEPVSTEKLMTLPARGVFAEARLGHCNASEIIDNTRFWDWQKSPITETPPDISPVDVNDSKNVSQNLAPSQLPTSIVNIVTPQNLPDPTGMANAMNLLGKADIFRDMSVSKEVADLLGKLSDNSIGIAEASNKAREIEATRAQASASPAPSTPTSPTPNLSPQQFMDWMNAVKNSGLPNQDKKDILQDVKEGAKATVNPKAPAVPQDPKTKDKRFVFQAVDYLGNTVQFNMEARVHDILANKEVFKGDFFGAGTAAIKFDAFNPSIKVFLTTKATTLLVPWGTLAVPQINKQTLEPIMIQERQKIVTVTLKQGSTPVTVEEKTKEEAAKKLAGEYGGKLGFDKVVAAEILAKDAKESVVTKGGEKILKFELKLPDNSYELLVK